MRVKDVRGHRAGTPPPLGSYNWKRKALYKWVSKSNSNFLTDSAGNVFVHYIIHKRRQANNILRVPHPNLGEIKTQKNVPSGLPMYLNN